ncbi:MAG TPA: right-handed parallel beta-helix repeat-containing protein [Thermoanaerobaculia bacterium]|nr:right-handed parallel beta-helix repeat-containing protein [Thermoanaerobaculia bacterium]
MNRAGSLVGLVLLGFLVALPSSASPPLALEATQEVGSLADKARPAMVRVDCRRRSITRALDRHQAPLVISFRGTCVEDVFIDRDRITLQGEDATAVIQGSVTVSGASEVLLEGFAVRNGPGNCVVVVRNSGAILRNLSVDHCGVNGILAVGSSQVFLMGTISSTDNGQGGMTITNASNVTLGGGSAVTLDRNGFGLILQLSSSATLLPGTLTANDNGGPGIVLASGGHVQEISRNMEATGNAGPGAMVSDGSSWVTTPATGVTRDFSDNGGAGIVVERGAVIDFAGTPTVASGNTGPGLHGDDGILQVGDLTAQGNGGVDVRLDFGSRATFVGTSNQVGTAECDDSSAARGTLSCS